MDRKTYAQHFELAQRTNGNEFIRTTQDTPEDLRELIHAVHKEFDALPCDWIYEQISNAFEELQYDEMDDITIEADCYRHELYNWFGLPFAHDVCQEVFEEGLVEPKDIYAWISSAQWYAKNRIYRMVNKFIQEGNVE